MSTTRALLLAAVTCSACACARSVGVERAACYPNNTCNTGLACVEHVCENLVAAEWGTPERAVSTLFAATRDGNRDKFLEGVVDAERQEAADAHFAAEPELRTAVGTAKIVGDRAEVPVTVMIGGHNVDAIVVAYRVKGVWRISKRDTHVVGDKEEKQEPKPGADPRTAEAVTNVKKIYDGARSYYEEESHARGSVAVLPKQFPNPPAKPGPVPPLGTCCHAPDHKCAPDPRLWTDATWQALKFSMDDPHYYAYEYQASGTGTSATFTVAAYGDLNCDGVYSTFEMVGSVQADGTVTGQGGMFINRAGD